MNSAYSHVKSVGQARGYSCSVFATLPPTRMEFAPMYTRTVNSLLTNTSVKRTPRVVRVGPHLSLVPFFDPL